MKKQEDLTVIGQQNLYDGLIDRTIKFLRSRRDKVLRGDINCISSPFERFRSEFVGIEQGTYYLLSGLTKSAKTQITNYIFIYSTILYAINNPDKVHLKIFYFPLEETPEAITLRFMAYLLYVLSEGTIRISPTDLKSTDSSKPLSQEVLDLLESDEYQRYMKFFEKSINFMPDRNPTGIWKVCKNYAEAHGKTTYKHVEYDVKVDDGFGNESIKHESRDLFDYYTPNDPKEYVIILTDHVSLLESEKGLDLRQTINKYSEYMIVLRNRYNYIPVAVQQQSTETGNLEAFKSGKIRPTMAGLSDSKYTAKDCSVMLGITNPHSFELPNYLGYDITKFKGNIRFLEVVLNRNGESNGICPLYFDGACNYFKELPLPNDKVGIERVYNYIDGIRSLNIKTSKSFFIYKMKKIVKKLHRWIE